MFYDTTAKESFVKKILLIGWIVAAFFLCGCGEASVAEVNGEIITSEEFDFYWDNLSKIYAANDTALADEMKQTVAEQLVYDALLEQVVAEYNCFPSAEEEEDFYREEMVLAYGSYEAGLELIEEYELSEEFFRYQYRCRLYEECIMDQLAKETDVTVSEEEAQEVYDAAPELYDWREVSHFLVKPYAADGRTLTADSDGNTIYTEEEWATAKASCEKYIAAIEDGEDFATIALKYSDSVDGENGGRIDEALYRDSEGYDEAFLEAAFALTEPGQHSEPIRTKNGYEVILLHDALMPERMDEMLARIIDDLEEENRRSLLMEYMAEREEKSDIVYHIS